MNKLNQNGYQRLNLNKKEGQKREQALSETDGVELLFHYQAQYII
jgi:hypothetical protein